MFGCFYVVYLFIVQAIHVSYFKVTNQLVLTKNKQIMTKKFLKRVALKKLLFFLGIIKQAKHLLFAALIFMTSLASAQSVVDINGKLRVNGAFLVNESGEAIQLRGMSSHGPQWEGNCYSFNSMKELVYNWDTDVFRLAMYVNENGYETDPVAWTKWVDDMVDLCEQFGIYCIIDWHILTPGDPMTNLTLARSFWSDMSQKYAGKDHVIYEICNEPNGVSWDRIKEYANIIIPIIRTNDPNTVIIVGTPEFSSQVDKPANDSNPLIYSNLMYAMHFYSASHDGYMSVVDNAAKKGLPIFVSEFGTTDFSGGGEVDIPATNKWFDEILAPHKISWCNWTYSDNEKSSSALIDNSCITESWNNTTTSGEYIKGRLSNPADAWDGTPGNFAPVANITEPVTNSIYAIGDQVIIACDPYDHDGSVASVQFYANGSKIGSAISTAPYVYSWAASSIGDFKLTAEVTDNEGRKNNSSAVWVEIRTEIIQDPYPDNVAHAIPGILKAVQYDTGGEGVAYHDAEPVNKGVGGIRTNEGVDTEGGDGVGNIGYVVNGEWLEYTVNIAQSGHYEIEIRTASAGKAGNFHIEIDGVNKTGLVNINPTGNWAQYQPTTFETSSIFPSGEHVLRIYADLANFNFSQLKFTYIGGGTSDPVCNLTSPTTNQTINLGASINLTASATDADGTISKVEFLANATIINSDASAPYAYSWTPTTGGTYTVKARATDNDGATDDSESITVTVIDNTPKPPVAVISASPNSGFAPLNVSFNGSGSTDPNNNISTYVWTISGTNYSGVTKSHTFNTPGTYAVTLTVTDATGLSDDANVTIIVDEPGTSPYAYGIVPANVPANAVSASYSLFKQHLMEECSGGQKMRVKKGYMGEEPENTVSEGIGYGMIMAAYNNDRSSFDKLWAYYQAYPDNQGLMHWKINGCNSATQLNAATDAECDVTFALVVADKVWGSTGSVNYGADARRMIGLMKQYEVEAGTFVLKPGDVFGGSNETNISYFSPGYFKVFGKFTNDEAFWNSVSSKCYDIIEANLAVNNAVGGIVSDWCKADGTQASGKSLDYSYDACRTPWRIATDYIWFGDARAKSYLDKTNNFLNNTIGGIENVVDGYFQNGTKKGSNHNISFVGNFACAGVAASNQATADAYYTELASLTPYSYFDLSFDLFAKMLLAGVYQNPLDGGNNPPIAALTADRTSGLAPLLVNFDASGSSDPEGQPLTYIWSIDGANVGTGSVLAHTFNTIKNYTVTLNVSDGEKTSSKSITITVSSGAPIAEFTATPTSGNFPLPVSFNASASVDPNGDALTYSWTFGDGTTGSGVIVNHTYTTAGNFTATLNVSDGSNNASKSTTITVNDPNQTGKLKVLYKDGGNGSPLDNSIHPHLQLVNTGTDPVAYGDITVRYYFTNEGLVNCNFFVDYAQVGSSNVSGSFAPVSPAVTGADYYLDVTFASSLGNLAAGVNSGNIQARFAKNNWSNFNEKDDYSYDATSTSYTENQNIVLFVKGVKVWGDEPGGSGNNAPVAVIVPSVLSGIAPLSVTFNGSGSSDPDGDAITYLWNSGETTSSISKTYTTAGTYTVSLTVSDGSLTNQTSVSVVVTSVPVSVIGVTVDPIGLNLTPGQTSLVIATVSPANATNKTVVWTSSNTAAANVNQSGMVTAVADGNAIITVTTNDGGFQATCNVLVETQIIHVTSVSVSPSSTTIAEGNTEQLAVTVLPSNATNKNVAWTSSNSATATVSQNGLVTAVAEGSAIITATSVDGSFTDNCIVTVTPAGGCSFGVPQVSPLASMNKEYTYLHVIGNGPNLNNVTKFNINWDLPNNGLWQMSVNTNNGQPNWYVDLRTSATYSLNTANPEISISGSGFSGLDGNYWVTMDGANLVWVEKTGAYTIYLSSSAANPCANKSGSIAASTKSMTASAIKMYPNPANDYVLISGVSNVKKMHLMNILGQVEGMDFIDGLSEFNFDLSKYKAGIYQINFELLNGELVQHKLIIK